MASKSREWSSFRLFASSQYALICILVFCCFRCALSSINQSSYHDPTTVRVSVTVEQIEALWNRQVVNNYETFDRWEGNVYELICPNGLPVAGRGFPVVTVFLLLHGMVPSDQTANRAQLAYHMYRYYNNILRKNVGCMAIVAPDYSSHSVYGVRKLAKQIMVPLTKVFRHLRTLPAGFRMIVWANGYGTVLARGMFSELSNHVKKYSVFNENIKNMFNSGLYFALVAGPITKLTANDPKQVVPDIALSVKESLGIDEERVLEKLDEIEKSGTSFLRQSNVIMVGACGDSAVEWHIAAGLDASECPKNLELFDFSEIHTRKTNIGIMQGLKRGSTMDKHSLLVKAVVNLDPTTPRGLAQDSQNEEFFSRNSSSHALAILNAKLTATGSLRIYGFICKMFRILSGQMKWFAAPRDSDYYGNFLYVQDGSTLEHDPIDGQSYDRTIIKRIPVESTDDTMGDDDVFLDDNDKDDDDSDDYMTDDDREKIDKWFRRPGYGDAQEIEF